MPRYIGFTPQFDPISLQDYLAVPTTILGEYAKAEDKFEEYQDKAEQLAAMVGEDPYGRQIINNYKNQLQNATNALSDGRVQNAEGLRQALGVRKYYRENMMPLEVGIPYWEQYKKAKLALGEDPLEDPLTLESFVRNPTQAYNLTKGSDVRNLAANMAKAASARRIKDPKYMGRVLEGNYYRTKSEAGFSDQEVQDWVNGTPNPELDEIRAEVQKQYSNISPEKLNRFINEGVYLGAVYDKKFDDKAVPKVTYSDSGSGSGSGNNAINWEDVWNKAFEGNGIKPVDRNLFNPSNSTADNGNLIRTTLNNGTIILKNPVEMVASFKATPFAANDTFGRIKELRSVVENLTNPRLKKMLLNMMEEETKGFDKSKYKNQTEAWNASITNGIYNKVARLTLAELFLKKNSDGSYSLEYDKNPDGSLNISAYKNKLNGSLFSGSRGNFEDIINQIESAGITNKNKFKNLDDFLTKLNNAYNNNNEFKTHGMTTSFALELDESEKERILNNIQGTWNVMGELSFKNGKINYNTKPLDEDDKNKILENYHSGKASIKTEFNQVNGENGPNNFYSAYVEDRTNGKKYHLVFTPEQWNGYTTNYDRMLTYANYYELKNVYEKGTPQQLQQIGSKNRMSFNEIKRQISICIQNNDMQKAEYWNKILQQAYENAYNEGLPSAVMQNNQALQAGWNQKSTVTGKHNANSEKADRIAK